MDNTFTVWVDGDSCPVPVREFLVRAALRGRFRVVFCANRRIPLKARIEPAVRLVVVTEEAVDEYLLRALAAATGPVLVVTRDIPLAERLLDLGVPVMNDRGRLFQEDSIRELRSLRDAKEAIRAQGLETMNPAITYGEREKKAFADALDRFLAGCAGNS